MQDICLQSANRSRFLSMDPSLDAATRAHWARSANRWLQLFQLCVRLEVP